jgi:phage tail protein X
MTFYVTNRDGERLDLICWRWYANLDHTVERTLAVNPGLASHDPANLPVGVRIVLPDLPARGAPKERVF